MYLRMKFAGGGGGEAGRFYSGPTSGPLAGNATQLASGSTVVITGTGAAQTPPAAPTAASADWSAP